MNFLSGVKSWLAKTLSLTSQAWVAGMDVPDSDAGAKLVSPYSQAIWVYVAVSTLARNIAQIPFRISRMEAGAARKVRALRGSADPRHRDFCRRALGEDVIESGPVVDLFARPHISMDGALFWETVVTWEALRGEFFIVPLDGLDQPVDLKDHNPVISRLLPLSPDMFWHMVVGYELLAWRYTGSPLISPLPSEVLAPSEVIHSRTPNPFLYWRGMSPIELAKLPAAGDYAASMFMKGLMMNNADTGVIVTTDQTPTPEQREQIVAALRERKRKAGTPDRPLFLWGGSKVEKPGISNVDMQFIETRGLFRKEILSIYGVPESMVGFSDAKGSPLTGGGAAINEDKLTFTQQTLIPHCAKYECALAPVIQTFDPGFVGWFDVDSLPVMQAARQARVDTGAKFFAMGVPFNDINAQLDLGYPEYKWHKVGYLPFNLQPADQMSTPEPGEEMPDATGANGENGEKPEEDGPVSAMLKLLAAPAESQISNLKSEIRVTRTDTARLWRQHMRARQQTVKLFTRKFGKVLNDFKGKTLAKLDAVHLEDKSTQPSALNQQKGLIDIIFNANEFGRALVAAFEKPTKETLNQAGKEARAECGVTDPWTMPPKKVGEFIAGREQSIMGVGGTVRDQLNTALSQGYDAGETHAELTARVREVFSNLSKGEAERVARTETNLAFNYARQDALDDAGIEYKSWLSSHGPNVREGHAEAEEAYMEEPIALNLPFEVELDGDVEQMMFPGDDSLGASAGNIINCQCLQLAAEKKEEDEKGCWYFIHGLGLRYFPRRVAGDHCSNQHTCSL